jgi:hypothetical protein
MVSRNMGEVAAAVRAGVSQSLEGMRPAEAMEPGLESMKAARVSVTTN